jgi:hypothetical protein
MYYLFLKVEKIFKAIKAMFIFYYVMQFLFYHNYKFKIFNLYIYHSFAPKNFSWNFDKKSIIYKFFKIKIFKQKKINTTTNSH